MIKVLLVFILVTVQYGSTTDPTLLPYTIITAFLNATNNPTCEEKLFSVVNNFLTEPAALTTLMNSGKGINDLGDYEACISNPNMRYILLRVAGLPIAIGLGICAPAECHEEDYDPLRAPLANTMTDLLGSIGFPISVQESDVTFTDTVKRNSEANLYSGGFFICVGVCLVIAIVSLVSSAVGAPNTSDKKPSTFRKVLGCFDVVKNLSLIFAITKTDEPELKIFNGLRVFVMAWIILGHVFFYSTYAFVINFSEMAELQTDFWNSYIFNATFSVDVFFFLSAFLLTYSALKQLHSIKKLPYAYIYFHRFLRLWPLLFVMTVIFCYIVPLYASGPAYSDYMELVNKDCKEYGYMNFLFINNFAPNDSNCMGWVWYLANDMQFFIITPVLVTIYYHRRKLGVFIVLVLLVMSLAATFGIAIKYKLSCATVKFSSDFFKYYYDKPYNRIVTYLIGILAAYVYTSYKREEKNYATKLSLVVKKNQWVRYGMYIISVAGMFMIIHTMYWMNKYPDSWSTLEDALYMVFAKVLFVLCLFLGIYPLMLGHGDTLRNFLGHNFFNPFARSTFGAYLVHPILMLFFYLNDRKGLFYDHNWFLFTFYSYFLGSYLISFIATALFESPIIAIDREFLRPKTKSLPEKKRPKEDESTLLIINSEHK